MTIQASEAIALVIVTAGYLPVLLTYYRHSHVKWMTVAYTALVVGAVATILEGFIFPDLLNAVEHGIGVMGAGLLFAWAAYRSLDRIAAVHQRVEEQWGDMDGG